jgi:hypothetical protein
MPPDRYTLIHRDASQSPDERDVLVGALVAMADEAEEAEDAEED